MVLTVLTNMAEDRGRYKYRVTMVDRLTDNDHSTVTGSA